MSIKLECPYLNPTRTITIKSPELGDVHTWEQKLQVSKAMSGAIYTYGQTPNNEKFNWNFKNLSLMQAEELSDFLAFCMGKQIKLTDFNAVVWSVVCTTETPVFTVDGTGKGKTTVKEAVSVNLQFEVF